jgi:adenylate cyclase
MIDPGILRPARTAFLISVGIFLVIGLLWRLGCFQEPELWIYDMFVRWHSDPKVQDPRIVLVQLGEKDIQRLDWPLRDVALAQVLQKIESGSPIVVGLDLYRDLPEPRDGSGSSALNQTFLRYPNIISIFLFGDENTPFVIPPPPLFTTGAAADPGRYSFNNFPDSKTIRRAFLYEPNNAAYSSFAFVLAQYYFAAHGIPSAIEGAGIRLGKTVFFPLHGNEGGYAGERAGGYQFLQDFRGPRTFETKTISEVLALGDTSIFRDKIVLIGIGADSSNDTFITPISEGRESGLVIHAQIVDQLLRAAINGERPTVGVGSILEWCWMALWGLGGILAGFFVRSHVLFALTLACSVGLIVSSAWLLFLHGYWILVFTPAVVFLATAMLVKAYAAAHERLERANLMKIFSQHVSPEIAEELWTHRETFLKGGRPAAQKLMVTVLFTDLKNYSNISEGMSPADLIAWVNDCQGALAQHVGKNRGIVNCYMGDGMMAVFGIPLRRTSQEEMKTDAINAVTCALAMGREIRQMNQRWRKEGKPLAGLRVGIYSGEAMAGVLGSDDHLAYSVIGDTVNTASRLESVDKEGVLTSSSDECRILIGALTYEYIRGLFPVRHVGSVNLKGKSETTEVYKILDKDDPIGQAISI